MVIAPAIGGSCAGEQLGERGLAVAVAAEQRDAVVRIDPEAEPRQDRLALLIADAGIVERQQRRAQARPDWGRRR